MPPQDNASQSFSHSPTGKSRPRRFWLLAGTAVLLGIGGLVAIGSQPAPTAATDPVVAGDPAMLLHPMEIETIVPQRLEEVVTMTGTVEPSRQAQIAAQVSGQAERVLVEPGDVVEEGDILIEVATTDLALLLKQQQSTMATSQVQLRSAQTSLARTQALADKGLAAQTTLDTAQADVDRLVETIATLETQVAQAQANLDRATIRAPFSGTIASRSIEPGQTVSQGTPLLSIVDLSTVNVEVVAALSDAGAITAGQNVRLTVQGVPGRSFSATVDRINPVAEEGTRSIKVHLKLDNADGLLRGGMFVTGAIVTRAADGVLALPETAVRQDGDQSFVIAVVDGRLVRQDIATGARWPDQALVEATGIASGDVVINTELPQLTAGMAVSISEGR